MKSKPRIAICFFGLGRSLRYTHDSIHRNIVYPAQSCGETRIFAHLYAQNRIISARTGEDQSVNISDQELLRADIIENEPPDACEQAWPHSEILSHGDAFDDQGLSLGNLLRQLHSLWKVTSLAEPWRPDLILFCRPDMFYFDSFLPCVRKALAKPRPICLLPWWQHFSGLNDRFAIVRGNNIALAYGRRIERALEFCSKGQRPLHSETFLKFALDGLPKRFVSLRAARVRASGHTAPREFFDHFIITKLHTKLHFSNARPALKRLGHYGLNWAQRIVDSISRRTPADPWDGWRKHGEAYIHPEAQESEA